MIDWQDIATRLAGLASPAESARRCRLLSLTLPLRRWPDLALSNDGDWCYWQRPDRGLRMVGSGRALAVTSEGTSRFAALHAMQRSLLADWRHVAEGGQVPPAPLAFTGFAYAPQGDGPLPNASLWVPELLLRECDGICWVTLSCEANQIEAAPARWRGLWQALRAKRRSRTASCYQALRNPLEDEAFRARGRAALRAIGAGQVDKLVLTRALRLKAAVPAMACAVLDALAVRHRACATFGVAGNGKVFLGSSPETLLALSGSRVTVDSLAGTAWQEAAMLLGDDKNRREHDFVTRAISAALATLCHDIVVPEAPEVFRINALTHLRRRVTASRPPDVSVFDIVTRLHPTPAVGGTPTAAAIDWLAQHGDRRDVWYTGGIGWIDAAGACDIVVALRCGLLDGHEATLYAGAGFVEGSDPEQELAETEAKFSAMLSALVACPEECRVCNAA